MIKFSVAAQILRQSGDIDIGEVCNSWVVVNRGEEAIIANGVSIDPFGSMGVAGNIGEIFSGRVNILFSPTDGAPAAVFIQKNYQ